MRCFIEQIPIGKVLKRSGVSYSTWRRQVRGARPWLTTIKRLHEALDELVAERDAEDRARAGRESDRPQKEHPYG